MGEEQIHLLERITEETNPFALQEQYNQTVDLQLERRRGPLPDPIEHFPPEIWLQIFRDVGSGHKDDVKSNPIQIFRDVGFGHKGGDDESNPIDHLLLASLVSAKWRDAILNAPEFWAEITVDPVGNSWEDDLFKLHMAIYLSGAGPLTLILRPSSYRQWEGEKGMHQIVSNHRSRIQKIFFVGAWHRNFPDCNINKMLLSLGPLPRLRVVHVVMELGWRELSWDDFLSNAPALVSINVVLPLEVLQGDRIKSFREISVSHLFDDFSMHLLKFQRMTSLSCWGGNRIFPPAPRLRQLPRNVGDLEEFVYDDDFDTIPAITVLQVTFKLTTLTISVRSSIYTLTTLLEVCHRLRSLINLSIELAEPPNPNDRALSGPTGPLAVRSLVIVCCSSIVSPGKVGIQRGRRYVAELIDILDGCTHAVEEFYFHARLIDYIPFKYISSRAHLFGLTLSIPNLLSIPDNMLIQSKSLVRLKLKIRAALISSFIRGLECPDLHRIVFLAGSRYGRPLSSPIATFDPATLPRLESIEWRNHPGFWQITSLQALRKIILTRWKRQMVSELCLHFTMRPHDCPSLEYIEFGVIPEWDLLFMMLERRNHSTRHGVSRITTLVFPTGISYSLLVPVTKLLSGNFATGISYKDVSISSIAEFYFDTSIPGCISCLLSMHSCARAVKIRGADFMLSWKPPKYRTSLVTNLSTANPPLSDEISSWLHGREERSRKWNVEDLIWRQQRTSRSNSCRDPIISKRMVVTELTLDGKSALIAFHSNLCLTQAPISTLPFQIERNRA